MNNQFALISEVIRNRRTVKPQQMNGQRIPDEQVEALLELADWAPTHGHTEPWRFYVYAGDSVRTFCREHADLYREETPETAFAQASYDKLLHMGDHASHIVIAVMRRGHLPKIPVLEEVAATSAAVQNLLLGAEALGIAAYWGSGGMVYRPAMKRLLGLREEDTVLGAIYLGYAAGEKHPGIRHIPVKDKQHWR